MTTGTVTQILVRSGRSCTEKWRVLVPHLEYGMRTDINVRGKSDGHIVT